MPEKSSSQPPIHWDDSSLQEVLNINFCNVSTTEEAVTLLFGTGFQEEGNLAVELRQRIPLRPVAAKMLRDLLQRHVAEYEALHGQISQGYQAVAGSQRLPQPMTAVASWPLELSPRAALMRELVEGLPTSHELERSWKFERGVLLVERFLLGVPCGAFGATATIRLPVLWKRLNLPESFQAEARRDLPGADYVHFGFEQGTTGCLYKLYLEQTKALEEAGSSARLLYTGYKWNPEAPQEAAVTRYLAYPRLELSEVDAKVRKELAGEDLAAIRQATLKLVELSAERGAVDRLLLVEVKDEDGARSSLDLNLYAAGMSVSEIYPFLAEMARAFAVPLAQLRTVYEEGKHCTLGHISAGRNRAGEPFFTVYYGGHSQRV